MENQRIPIHGLVLFILLLALREAYSSQCHCGKPVVQRVVGGTEARVADYPWLLALYINVTTEWKYQCGASLIHPQWAITASHCVETYGARRYPNNSQCLNALNQPVPCFINARNLQAALASAQGTVREFTVLQILPHPWYNPGQHPYDIALVQLTQPVNCGLSVSLICVTEGERMDYPNKPVTLAGWGKIGPNVPGKSEKLKQTQLWVLPRDQCTESKFIPDVLCTNGNAFAGTACQGDSGGPLMYEENGLYYVTGVVSYGKGLCQITGHVMFTQLTTNMGWIMNYVPLREVQKAKPGG